MSQEPTEIVLTQDGGLIKRILQAAPAENIESPEKGDKVTVHYTGRLTDGTVFDSSVERKEPFVFKIGEGQVIKGWDLGVASMKKGERAILICKPEYAYGKAGSPPKIPADATLEFEVELISWKNNNDLSGDGGVVRKILKKGPIDKSPSDDYEVSVHYVGKFEDGRVFDSSRDRNQKLTWIIGKEAQGVLKPFEMAVKKMNVGDIYELKLTPEYAYGAQGNPQLGVPANTKVIFEIELLEMMEIEELTPGVVMKTLKEGDGWKKPEEDGTVEIKVKGKLQSAHEPFLAVNEPTKFVLGEGKLPEAVELALTKMKKGQLSHVAVSDTDFCYTPEENQAKGIPAGKHAVEFEIELIDFEEPAVKSWEMEPAQKVEKAKKLKDSGNVFFKAGRFRQVKQKYQGSVALLTSDYKFTEEEKKAAKELKLSLHLNLAAVYLKIHDYKEAVENCKKALEIDKNNSKALFRRATARYHTALYDEAKADLQKAAEISPQDKEIKALQGEITKKLKVYHEKDKKAFAGMFEKLASETPSATTAAATTAGNNTNSKPSEE